MYPADYLYSKDHEWIRVEGEVGVLGITHFAQDELGEVVFVELPEVGDTFEIDTEMGNIESVKAVAEVFTPVSGEVIEVNDELVDDPAAVNDDPHGKGWLVKIQLGDKSQLEGLMSAEAYEAFAAGEES
jgi:glycine cleavage system H protein